MRILIKIKNKLQYYTYHCNLYYNLIKDYQFPIAYVFGAPLQRNMGDQAQSYCIAKWIHENYKEYKIKIIVIPHTTNRLIKFIKKTIKDNDKIFFHSGYHLTDLYNVKEIYFKCIHSFNEKEIICFPQTVYFKETNNLLTTANEYNSHKNIILLCRDEQSYNIAKKVFNIKLLLFPDIVTSLIGKYQFENKREGVLFCIRNDVESLYSKEQIKALKNRFSCRTETTDTTITIDPYYIVKHRIEILENILNYYSTFKVIITDRYHGTIFSLISNTPVIVISSTDHKLSSGVKWFPKHIFGDYITYASNLNEAYEKALILTKKAIKYQLPPYFENEYFSKLKDIIDEKN